EPHVTGPGCRRPGGGATAASVPQGPLGKISDRHSPDPARRSDVGSELLRVARQPARPAARRSARPLPAATTARLHDRRDRTAGRCAGYLLQGGVAVSHRDDRDASDEAPAGVPGDYEEPRPGLASERTDLAWTRSAVAFVALGAAILKIRPVVGFPVM